MFCRLQVAIWGFQVFMECVEQSIAFYWNYAQELLLWRSNQSVFLPFSRQSCIWLYSVIYVGVAKSRKHHLTPGEQNTFCKSDPNVDGVADVRIDRWILQEWSHAACRLTQFQRDQVVRPGCTHAVVTHCCSGRSIRHMSRAVAWQSRHESVCAQPVSFTVRCTRLRHILKPVFIHLNMNLQRLI